MTQFTETQLKEATAVAATEATTVATAGEETVVPLESAYKSDSSKYGIVVQGDDQGPTYVSSEAPNTQSSVNEAVDQGADQSASQWQDSIPEQFRADTPEAALAKMNAAYQELNKSNAEAQAQAQAQVPQRVEAPDKTSEEAFGKAIAKIFDENHINGLDLRERFFRYGELTKADDSKLEDAGINPEMFKNSLLQERNHALQEHTSQIEAQAQTQQAQKDPQRLNTEQTTAILQEYANGSMDQMKQMVSWGHKNLGSDTIQGIQDAIDTGNTNVVRAAISGLHTAYIASQGQEKPLAVTGGQPASSGLGPVNAAEAAKILNDPRWSSRRPEDRAWRYEQTHNRVWL